MSKVQRGLILWVAAAIIGVWPAGAADFYETQLRLGAEAYRTGRLPDAIDYLRIANFGLLDRPELLLEGLSRLALAQNAAGRPEETLKTIERFVVVERQFPAWKSATIDPDLRQEFEKLAREKLTPEAVSSVPSLRADVPPAEPRVSTMTPDERVRYYEDQARSHPGNAKWPLLLAQEEARAGDTKSALKWSERALDRDPGLVDARILRVSVLTARKEYGAAARELALVPAEAWFQNPSINADAFVIYVRANEIDRAGEIFNLIPSELSARPDVVDAMAGFRQWESSRLEEQAMKEIPEEGDVDVPAAPEGAPVKGTEEPVEARIRAPRGSFTSPEDPVGEALSTSKRLVGEGRAADAQLVLRDALRRYPGVRELRLAMLEASCLAKDWRTGISQLLLIEPFKTGEEKYMFYGSIVYFESEKPDEARDLMRSALPKLARTQYVDYYARRVLGE